MEQNNQTPGDKTLITNRALQSALAGEYSFDLKQIIMRAHRIAMNNIWTLVQACVIFFVALIIMAVLVVKIFAITDMTKLTATQQALTNLAIIFVMAPLQTGLIMLGINGAAGKKIAPIQVFSFYPLTFVLALNQLIVSIFVEVGLALMIVPGLYVFIATSFSLPLLAEKRLTVTSALLLSARVVNRYFLMILALFGFFLVLFVISFFTFGFALIYVLPLYFATLGVVYTDLFGVEGQAGPPTSSESTFNA